MPDTNPRSASSPPQPWDSHSALNAAKSECSSVESVADFCRSPGRRRARKSRGSLMACYLAAKLYTNNRPQTPARYLPGGLLHKPKTKPDTYQAVLNRYVPVLKPPLLMVNPSPALKRQRRPPCCTCRRQRRARGPELMPGAALLPLSRWPLEMVSFVALSWCCSWRWCRCWRTRNDSFARMMSMPSFFGSQLWAMACRHMAIRGK